jgi:transcription elongation GreA/GreB family factor
MRMAAACVRFDRGVEDTNNGDVITYQIVGDDEANIRERKI